MKLERNEVEYSGNTPLAKRTYTISDPTWIMKMMIDMYPNPILAVVREYICNAVDSHVAAGKPDVPVKVIAPSLLHMYFEVHDEGVGLDGEEVDKFYCDFGGSNKRDTNAQIGGFGIGCKSVFAYSKSFTLETIKNGVKRVYIGVDNADMGPMIELLSSTTTTQPNGVKFKVKVKASDIQVFSNTINKICQFLPVTPEVTGMEQPVKAVPISSGSDWGFYENGFFDYQFYIKMGGVVYKTGTNTKFYKALVVDAPIGSFKLAPSRESVITDDKVREFAQKKMNEIQAYLEDRHQREIDAEPTLFRAVKRYHKNTSILRHSQFKYRNRKTQGVHVYNLSIFMYKSWGTKRIKKENHGICYSNIGAIYDSEEKKTLHAVRVEKIFDHIDKKLAVLHLHGTPKQRYKQWVKAGKPDVPYFKWSDLELPNSNSTKTPTLKRPVQFKIYDSKYNRILDQNIDVSSGEVYRYLKTENGDVQLDSHTVICTNGWLQSVIEVGQIKHSPIVLVPKTIWNKIPDHWVDLKPFILDLYKDYSNYYIPKVVLEEWLRNQKGFKSNTKNLQRYYPLSKYLDKGKYIDLLMEFTNNRNNNTYPRIHDPILSIKENDYYLKFTERVNNLVEKIENHFSTKYPLIDTELVPESLEYVEFINRKHQTGKEI